MDDQSIYDSLSNLYAQMGGVSFLAGVGAAGLQQADMNAQEAAMLQNMVQQQSGASTYALGGFARTWDFDLKAAGPEQYGPFRPKQPEWRYKTRYAEGRENVWMPALRDPGGRLLKICAYLAIYPAIAVAWLLIRGLIWSLF